LIFTRALNYLPEIHPHLRARLQNSSLQAQMTATVAGFGCACYPRTSPAPRPVWCGVAGRDILKRTYWMIVDADMAQTAQVRLTQRFLRGLLREAGTFLPGPLTRLTAHLRNRGRRYAT